MIAGPQQVAVTKTVTRPVKHTKVTKVRGKWVTRAKRTVTTTLVTSTTTSYVAKQVTTEVPNVTYQTVLADAASFYASQPAPYNAGTCPI